MGGILLTSGPQFQARVRKAFGGELNGNLRRWRQPLASLDIDTAVDGMAADHPQLIALGPNLELDKMLELTRALDRRWPEISVVLVAEPSPMLWESALKAGARGVVAPGAGDTELRDTFEAALATADRRSANLASPVVAPKAHGRIITVTSPKGGVGKTTVATNLAVGLARSGQARVALVDLDLQFGDVATTLNLTPEHSLASLAASPLEFGGTAVKAMLTPHRSGVHVLCAPALPGDGEELPADSIAQVLRFLSEEFTHLVIDTSGGLSEHTLAAIELSTDIVIVCAMDVPTVRSTRKAVDALDALAMTYQTRHIVLNRSDSRVGLGSHDVQATLGLRIDTALVSSRTVPVSTNRGSPVLESDPKSPLVRPLLGLVDRLSPALNEPTASRLAKDPR